MVSFVDSRQNLVCSVLQLLSFRSPIVDGDVFNTLPNLWTFATGDVFILNSREKETAISGV